MDEPNPIVCQGLVASGQPCHGKAVGVPVKARVEHQMCIGHHTLGVSAWWPETGSTTVGSRVRGAG